jgi:hypothetical protein
MLTTKYFLLLFLCFLTGCGVSQTTNTTTGPQGPQGPAGPPGLIFLNVYNAVIQYVATDVVTYQGSTYVALTTNTGVLPDWVAGQCSPLGGPSAGWSQWRSRTPGPLGFSWRLGICRTTRTYRANRSIRAARSYRSFRTSRSSVFLSHWSRPRGSGRQHLRHIPKLLAECCRFSHGHDSYQSGRPGRTDTT